MLGNVIIIIAWVAALLGAVIGGFLLLSAITVPAAPGQAAAAAVAIGCAVIPYVFARACESLHRPKHSD